MHVVRTRAALREAIAGCRRPLGFVPTMGWLHEGHVSLIRRARSENESVLVSIFVNPRQFTDRADYATYPRDEARDLAICGAERVDLVFVPSADEIYPPGFDTTVSVGRLARPLEGAARPGHFDGVATVVAILLDLAGAERAYFGQKDAQQLLVVRRMVADLAIPTEIVGCPTVREPDGLAVSSRNVHLSPAERAAAPVLHRALAAAKEAWAAGERSGEALRAIMRRILEAEPLAAVEYVSVADAETLDELDWVDGPALLSLAARFGTTRLIDNEPIP
ncbi:MAG TPA: pantoate--beta-alanine ligase [Candidatus Limnocylindrales bacterium]|nr:pantoate--beta-alanine ligase [Candidatus Limnocylindrales bacterium]